MFSRTVLYNLTPFSRPAGALTPQFTCSAIGVFRHECRSISFSSRKLVSHDDKRNKNFTRRKTVKKLSMGTRFKISALYRVE